MCRDPKHHINISILSSGPKAQPGGDSRNYVLWNPCVDVVSDACIATRNLPCNHPAPTFQRPKTYPLAISSVLESLSYRLLEGWHGELYLPTIQNQMNWLSGGPRVTVNGIRRRATVVKFQLRAHNSPHMTTPGPPSTTPQRRNKIA